MGCGSSAGNASEKKAENDLTMNTLDQLIPSEATAEDRARRKELFYTFDKNNTKKLTYEEVLSGCRDELELDKYTNNLPSVVRRAFNEAKTALNDVGGGGSDEQIEYMEFNILLRHIRYYLEISVVFQSIDTSGDNKVDKKEFKKGVELLAKYGVIVDDPEEVFEELDQKGSGKINYDQFLEWATDMVMKTHPEEA